MVERAAIPGDGSSGQRQASDLAGQRKERKMFPLLPSTILQIQSSREQYAADNEEAHAQKHGRVVHHSVSKEAQVQSTPASSADARPASPSPVPATPQANIKLKPSVKLAHKAHA